MAAVIALWLAGCAYRVALTSLPMPARVSLPNGEQVVTPAEARLRWAPFRSQIVTATAPGYRPLEVDLRRREIRLGHLVGRTLLRPSVWRGGPLGEVRLVLVREHGPSGTWTTDEPSGP